MTTVINTPSPSNDNSGTGIVVGVLVAIVLIALFIVYGLPAIRKEQPQQEPTNTTNIIVLPVASTTN